MIREQSHQALILFHIHQAIEDHCAENVQKPLCVFQKLWSFASTQARAFATFSPTAKSTYLGQILS